MKKKISLIIIMVSFIISTFAPTVAYANMAAPEEGSTSGTITFEKNQEISVTSEILDIVVDGDIAHIKATYSMKNTTDKAVSTPSMFLSPNIEGEKTSVTINGSNIDYTTESYRNSAISMEGWEYKPVEQGYPDDELVDIISFTLDFDANEDIEVTVSYLYKLGGYPTLNYNAKQGNITYFLEPAANWKNFSNLTINLTLDDNLPVLKYSNMEFEKVDDKIYQFKSDTLPDDHLQLTLDETWFQEFIGFFKSPYLVMYLAVFGIPILVLVGIPVAIIITIRIIKKRKLKKLQENDTNTIDKKNL